MIELFPKDVPDSTLFASTIGLVPDDQWTISKQSAFFLPPTQVPEELVNQAQQALHHYFLGQRKKRGDPAW